MNHEEAQPVSVPLPSVQPQVDQENRDTASPVPPVQAAPLGHPGPPERWVAVKAARRDHFKEPVFDDGIWEVRLAGDEPRRGPICVIDLGDDHHEPTRKEAEARAREIADAHNEKPGHRDLLLKLIASLTLCDHMGDVSSAVGSALERMGIAYGPKEDEEEDDWGVEVRRAMHKLGVTTLHGTDIGEEEEA